MRLLPWFLTAASIGALIYFLITTQALQDVEKAGYVCSNYSTEPINTMSRKDVVDMVSNYYTKQYQALHDINSTKRLRLPMMQNPAGQQEELKDSRAVFFNLDTLKRMIYYMEKASKGYTALEKQNLGLNVYFASYPEIAPRKIKNGVDYTNRHTLVFIPSIFNTTKNTAEDIDMFVNLKGGKPDANPIPNNFYNNTGGIMALAADMNSQNNGTATPPPVTPTGNILLDVTGPQ